MAEPTSGRRRSPASQRRRTVGRRSASASGPAARPAANNSQGPTVATLLEEAEKKEPKTKAFVAAYRAAYKGEFPYDQAPQCATSCYDHVYALVDAMQRAGSVDDVPKVKAALMSTAYKGLWNNRDDASGEAVFDFDVVELQKGGKVSVTHVEPK